MTHPGLDSRKRATEVLVLATAESIIDEARNGRMFILVDDEDRENEGDLVIPAQIATPAAINFMAREGRGLVCLAMTSARIQTLGLDLMGTGASGRFETAFTTSIEARSGVTTGISAADRARTIAVAINTQSGGDDIVSPGHVFPLRARDGGVLVRAGHTEAAVDIARLAGLNPSGVICEIMNDDGTMARLADLIPFAKKHGLMIGTIRDLIAYRLRHDHNLDKIGSASFSSRFGGNWTAHAFRNQALHGEMLAITLGEIKGDAPTLVRMHVFDAFSDVFGVPGEREGLLQRAMMQISRAGSGVIVMLTRQINNQLEQFVLSKTDTSSPAKLDSLRDYGVGAQILTALGVRKMELLTNSPRALAALEGFGIAVSGYRTIDRDLSDGASAIES